MPKYSPEDTKEEIEKKPRLACQGLADDLLHCLWESDCVRKHRMTPRECLKDPHNPDVPQDCKSLSNAFFECKRSLIDMRTRFRGIKGY